MARVWLGASIGAVGVFALLAMTNCAEPTQIVLDIYTDACPSTGKPQVINATGVAVGTAETIESRRPSSTKEGCESKTGVGTLTIYPSGEKDGEVAIKVLGGVESSPDRCDPPLYAGCIVFRRMMRFEPNKTQRATVRLLLACLNRECPLGSTCDNGACVSDKAVLEDGGAAADAERTESSAVAPIDGGPPDTADPLCAGCLGDCVPVTGGTKKCVVDCSKVNCNGQMCAKALDCEIKCKQTGKCNDVQCTTDKKCTVNCTTEKDACATVTCRADECNVSCKDGPETCKSAGNIILIAARKGRLVCVGKNACKEASCVSQNCALTCTTTGSEANCPIPRPCAPVGSNACDNWNNPPQN